MEILEKLNECIKILNEIVTEHSIIKKYSNVNLNENLIPDNYTYAEQFSKKYLFVSSATISDILKKSNEIEVIKTSRIIYFDPKCIIRYIINNKPPMVYNNMNKFYKLIPELKELIDSLN